MIPSSLPGNPSSGQTLNDLSEQGNAPIPTAAAPSIAEFVACARDKSPQAVSGTVRAGADATAAVLACFESIRTGQPVPSADEQSS